MGKFGDSFKRQLGRDTGRFVSNVLFGNKHAAPVRVSHRQEGKERLEKLRYKNEVKLEKLRHKNQMALEREQQKRANAQDAEESHSLTGMVYPAFTPPVENAAAQEPGFDAGFDPEFEPAFEPTEPPAQRQAATGTNYTASPSTPAGNGFMGDVLNIELPDNPDVKLSSIERTLQFWLRSNNKYNRLQKYQEFMKFITSSMLTINIKDYRTYKMVYQDMPNEPDWYVSYEGDRFYAFFQVKFLEPQPSI